MRSESEIRKQLDIMLSYHKKAQAQLLAAESSAAALYAYDDMRMWEHRAKELQWVLEQGRRVNEAAH